MVTGFILFSINKSSISWTRGRYSSDIDHELVNSSMLEKNIIPCTYFIDYPSISDHKLLIVYYKKIIIDESFLLPKKKKKKFIIWDRYKCLEPIKEICDHNKFEILIKELGNEEHSQADSII